MPPLGHRQIVDSALGSSSSRFIRIQPARRALASSVRRLTRKFALFLLTCLGRSEQLYRSSAGWRGISSGAVIYSAVRAGLIESVDTSTALSFIHSSTLLFQILTSRAAEPGTARDTLRDLAMLPPPLRNVGAIWLARQQSLNDELPGTVYEALALDGPAALGSSRLDLTLLQIRRVASGLSEPQALSVLATLWPLASAPPDPYNPNAHRASASAALVHLLATRPEIESAFVARAGSYVGHRRRDALDVLARAIRSRGPTASSAMVKWYSALNLSAEEGERFTATAEIAQRTAPIRNSGQRRRPSGSRGRRAASWLGLLLLWAYAPLAVLISFRVHSIHPAPWMQAGLTDIPFEGAITLVALIATINVFTVQLSTTRLPGTVARVAGQPWQLFGAYSSAITLLGMTTISPSVPPILWKPLATGLLVSSLIWLTIALARIFRRTDAGEACRVYVLRNVQQWNRAGKRFGTEQWEAAHLARGIEALPFAGTSSGQMIGHDVDQVEAKARGIFMPNRRKLRSALSDRVFAEGGYVQFALGFGLVVPAGETLALIRPPSGQSVRTGLHNKLSEALRPRPAADVEDVSTQAVTLASLALRTAEMGDARLAEAIAEQSAIIVTSHLASVQRQRLKLLKRANSQALEVRTTEPEVYAVSPVLRDMLALLVAHAGDSESVGAVTDIILTRCLAASSLGEQAPTIVVSLLSSARQNAISADRLTSWLRQAGMSALALRNDNAFSMAVSRLKSTSELPPCETLAMRSVAALCAAAMRLRPGQFQTSWPVLADWSQASAHQGESIRLVLQVGAAALEGNAT